MVIDLGRRFGLKVSPPVAARLAESAGNDQAIVAQELQKFALYIGASPEAPRELDHEAVDAVGAESAEGDFLRLADLALSGEVDELADELARLPAGGSEAIPVVRSLQRRLLMLAPLRARVERGERPDAVMTSLGKSLFFKDQAKVRRMLSQWTAEGSGDRGRARRQARAVADVHAGARPRGARRGTAGDRAEGAVRELDRLAREPLADHVELVEARIMERDCPALPLVHDLDLEAEQVAELALEHFEVGIDGLGGVAGAGAADVGARARDASFRAARGLRPDAPTAPWRRSRGSVPRDRRRSRRRGRGPC